MKKRKRPVDARSSLWLMLILIITMLLSCKEDSDANRDQEMVEVSVDPQSPLLMRINRDDGIVVDYFGTKDQQGKALTLDLVSILQPGNSVPLIAEMNVDGSPAKFISPDGQQFQFHWESETKFRVIATSADGEIQVNVPFDYNDMESGRVNSRSSNRIGRKLRIDAKPLLGQELIARTGGNGFIDVNVEKCGMPYQGTGNVYLAIRDDHGKPFFNQRGTLSGGVARIDVPNPGSKKNLSDLCEGLQWVTSNACEFIAPATEAYQIQMCASIAAAADFTIFGPTGESIPIFAGCETLLNSFHIYCKVMESSPVQGGPSLSSELCKVSKALDETTSTYSFKAYFYAPGEEAASVESTGAYGVGGDYPSMKIVLPNKLKVQDFITYPVDPQPEEDYVARAQIFCAPDGTTVTVSIIGTDGYTDEVTYTIEGDSEISLFVPGAEEGIQDRLKIVISEGETMYAGIVF
jgi:hypothetical protein